MPCLCGRFPVAIEFHSIGDKIGCSVARLLITPSPMKRSNVGIKPASSSGWMIFQSAASQPISNTRFARRGPAELTGMPESLHSARHSLRFFFSAGPMLSPERQTDSATAQKGKGQGARLGNLAGQDRATGIIICPIDDGSGDHLVLEVYRIQAHPHPAIVRLPVGCDELEPDVSGASR